MLIDNIQDEAIDGWRRLTADVRFDYAPERVEKFWIHRSDPDIPFQQPGNILLVGFILPSMAAHEPLRIEAPVSRDVMNAELSKVTPLLRSWYPHLAKPQLDCELADSISVTTDKTGALFSGGIDSWVTLVENQTDIDTLIHFQGFEIGIEHSDAFQAAHDLVQSVADDFGKNVLTLGTNLGSLVRARIEDRPDKPWYDFRSRVFQGHGAVSRILSLSGLVNKVYIPGSYSREIEHVGSHAGIEETLSTQICAYVLDSIDRTRMEKVDFLLKHYPGFLPNLRICVSDNPPATRPLNCGGCIKCVRTAMELRVCGARDYNGIFANQLNLKQARLLNLYTENISWYRLVDRAIDVGDTEVRDAALMIMREKGQLKRRILRLPYTWQRLKRKLLG